MVHNALPGREPPFRYSGAGGSTVHAFRPVTLSLLLLAAGCSGGDAPRHAGLSAGQDWPAYLGDSGSTHYSTLDQITTANVARLEVAWTFDTLVPAAAGDAAGSGRGDFQTNNLIVNGVLYTASPARHVIALDAATGLQRWRFDPRSERDDAVGNRQRGLAYWTDGSQRRVFTSAGTWLYALDAVTGKPVRTFGDNGSIHLGRGLGLGGTPTVRLNTPGVIYKDLIIVGGLIPENVAGGIRAFDVRSGELKWTFRTIPRPGEPGYETWPPDAWKTAGGASDWSGHSVDQARGIVYVSTETAGPDFWGGDRYGENLFANSIIALDANTGRRLWHYQVVHHDLWDLDLPAPPTLLTVTHGGKRIDAVAQGTKHGLLFAFDRVTGTPLWPIREQPTVPSRLPGVKVWPTQPVPEKPAPLMRQRYTADDVSTISPLAQLLTTERLARSGNSGAMPPPSLDETILFPGPDGGFEWGGAAADPGGVLYANVNEIPWFYRMVPTRSADGTALSFGHRQYLVHCAACHGADRRGDVRGGMPALHALKGQRSLEQVLKVMQQGGGRMPPFDRLSIRQRTAIAGFLFGTETAAPDASAGHDEATPAGGPAVRLRRFPALVRPRGLPCHQAAVGHAQRGGHEHRRAALEGASRRVSRAHRARHCPDGHRELRRTGGDRRRVDLHRRQRR